MLFKPTNIAEATIRSGKTNSLPMPSRNHILMTLLILFTFSAIADETDFPTSDINNIDVDFMDERETIYTATRFVKRLDQAPAVATVITSEQIRHMGARSLYDVLRRVPGVGIAMNTPYGVKGIEIRGINTILSEKVLVLLDGHKLNDTLRGSSTFEFDNIPLHNIQRIEVLRGPASALYGANAFSGIINIITNKADDIGDGIVWAGAGSYNTYDLSFQSKKEENGKKAYGYIYRSKTDGLKADITKDDWGYSGVTDMHEKQSWAALTLEQNQWEFYGKAMDRKRGPYIGVAGVVNDETKIKDQYLLLELTHRSDLSDHETLSSKVAYTYSNSDKHWEIFSEGVFPGYPANQSMYGFPDSKKLWWSAEAQYDTAWSDKNIFTAGINYEHLKLADVTTAANFSAVDYSYDPPFRDKTDTENWAKNSDEDLIALFLQNVWRTTNTLETTIGIRHDQNSNYGSATSPRIGLVWNTTPKFTSRLLYGEAFRAPGFAEAYITNNPVIEGNKTLNPEIIKTLELNFFYRHIQGISFETTLFKNEISDLIKAVPEPGGKQKYQNIDSVDIQGAEFELRWAIDALKYGYINATYLDTLNKTIDQPLSDIADRKGNIGLNWNLSSQLNFNGNLSIVGDKRRASGDPRPNLKGYYLLDVALLYHSSIKGLDIKFSIYNLLNDTYQDPSPPPSLNPSPLDNSNKSDFPAPNRNYFIDAIYSF